MQFPCVGFDDLGPCGRMIPVRSLDLAGHYCPEHTPKRVVVHIPCGLYDRLLTRLRGRPISSMVTEALTKFLEEDQ